MITQESVAAWEFDTDIPGCASGSEDVEVSWDMSASILLYVQAAADRAVTRRLNQLREHAQISWTQRMQAIADKQRAELELQHDKLKLELEQLRRAGALSEQFQRTTPILKRMDQIFKLYDPQKDKYRRQVILKLRSALKLNRTSGFTPEQLDVLDDLIEQIGKDEITKKEVFQVLDRLEDSGLSPFPPLEEEL